MCRYGVALVGIKQDTPGATIQLNPGSRHVMKAADVCFYMSVTKEENSAFILAHPNEDKDTLFRHGSIKALARAGSYRYSKVTSIVATVG
jgi:potassium channel subfamily T protein 1